MSTAPDVLENTAPRGLIGTVRIYGSFVKFSHTIFALPFAVTGYVLALAFPKGLTLVIGLGDSGISDISMKDGEIVRTTELVQTTQRYEGIYHEFSIAMVLMILGCMVGARCFAMAFNRIADRRIDALNPRTASRELPAGKLSLTQAWVFALLAAVLYFGCAIGLGPVTAILSPIPIALMTLYPFTKRFTALCHFVLGASLGIAPVGAWVAVQSGNWQSPMRWDCLEFGAPWILGGAVMCWVAGFDIIYALQDDEFDRDHKLHSIPAALGRSKALWVARATHLIAAALFFVFFVYALGLLAPRITRLVLLPSWVVAGAVVMTLGMIYQHTLVKADNLSRVNVAFFTVNGVVSAVFGLIFVAGYLTLKLARAG